MFDNLDKVIEKCKDNWKDQRQFIKRDNSIANNPKSYFEEDITNGI